MYTHIAFLLDKQLLMQRLQSLTVDNCDTSRKKPVTSVIAH